MAACEYKIINGRHSPRLEPVNHCRVDGGQEALRPNSEVLKNGAGREDHMQVGTDLHVGQSFGNELCTSCDLQSIGSLCHP